MLFDRLDYLYSRQGLEISRKRLILFTAIASIALGSICFLQMRGSFAAGAFGFFLGLFLPSIVTEIRFYFWSLRCRRDLPYSLTMIVAGLKSGMALPQAMDYVREHFESPLSREYRLVLANMQIGQPLLDAIRSLDAVLAEEDAKRLRAVFALTFQTGTGLETLEDLAARFHEKQNRKTQDLRLLAGLATIAAVSILALSPKHFSIPMNLITLPITLGAYVVSAYWLVSQIVARPLATAKEVEHVGSQTVEDESPLTYVFRDNDETNLREFLRILGSERANLVVGHDGSYDENWLREILGGASLNADTRFVSDLTSNEFHSLVRIPVQQRPAFVVGIPTTNFQEAIAQLRQTVGGPSILKQANFYLKVETLNPGETRVTLLTELKTYRDGDLSYQDVFVFRETGFDKNRKLLGKTLATGLIPGFVDELHGRGVFVPRQLFSNESVVESKVS